MFYSEDMSGSRHWSGVQSWLVVACLMIVVEYSTCTLLEEMDLMRHRNAEKKGGLSKYIIHFLLIPICTHGMALNVMFLYSL